MRQIDKLNIAKTAKILAESARVRNLKGSKQSYSTEKNLLSLSHGIIKEGMLNNA